MFNDGSLDQDNKEGNRRAKMAYLKCKICGARRKQEDMQTTVTCKDCSKKQSDPSSSVFKGKFGKYSLFKLSSHSKQKKT